MPKPTPEACPDCTMSQTTDQDGGAQDVVSIEVLRECLSYDPVSGEITWLHRPRSHFLSKRAFTVFESVYAGKPAFPTIGTGGYRYGTLSYLGVSRRYTLHTVAWALMTGAWPIEQVDHRDVDRLNNRWDNLRAATHAQNNQNRPVQARNKTGFKGVVKVKDRFLAFIKPNNRSRYLGSFNTAQEANEAYRRAAIAAYGEFARS